MKFCHISDLHLGRKLSDISLINDQKYILDQILEYLKNNKIDFLMIAGDVYDKVNPSNEAMKLYDYFIRELVKLNILTFITSGNHDSITKLEYLSTFLDKSNIYISAEYSGKLKKYTYSDEYGKYNIYLLPFIKPEYVRRYYPDDDIDSYNKAIEVLLNKEKIDYNERNIIIGHQFLTGSNLSGSEEMSIGGIDNIDANLFINFDYAGFGHIHREQKIIKDYIRYSGSIMKYSISEEKHNKSMTIVEIKNKNEFSYSHYNLLPINDVRTIKDTLQNVLNQNLSYDYVSIILTDEDVLPDARIKVCYNFPNMIRFGIENSKTKYVIDIINDEKIESKSFEELFIDFYKYQNNDVSPSSKHLEVVKDILSQIKE